MLPARCWASPALRPLRARLWCRIPRRRGTARLDGGPSVILHYNGNAWSKVAGSSFAATGQVVSDGKGGLWIAAEVLGTDSHSYLLHYSGGRLAAVAAPKFDPVILQYRQAAGQWFRQMMQRQVRVVAARPRAARRAQLRGHGHPRSPACWQSAPACAGTGCGDLAQPPTRSGGHPDTRVKPCGAAGRSSLARLAAVGASH